MYGFVLNQQMVFKEAIAYRKKKGYLLFTGYSIIKILIDHYFETFIQSNSYACESFQ